MTIPTTNSRDVYTGNGSTTGFSYTFKILDESEIIVKKDSVTQVLNSDYTITNVGNDAGGLVVFSSAPASGAVIVLQRNMPFTQLTDYTENDNFPAETHEAALDKRVMEIQQVKDMADRSIKLPDSTTLANVEVINPVAGSTLVWNGTADGITSAALGNTTGIPSTTLLYPTTSTGVPNDTLTLVQLSNAVRDVPGYHDVNKVTMGAGGWVRVRASVEWATAFQSTYRFFGIRVNGTTYIAKCEHATNAGSLNMQMQTMSHMRFLNAGDYIELVVLQKNAATNLYNLAFSGTTWLEVEYFTT